jgi:hypothetical protein
MRKLVLLLLLAPALFAGSFPLTNTRYGPIGIPGTRVLTTNGSDLFLVWSAGGTTRITRLVESENRVGRPVLDGAWLGVEAVWTGRYFLVFGQSSVKVSARLLDRDGEPLGEQFAVGAGGYYPTSAATNGKRVLLLYRTEDGAVRTKLLTESGRVDAADTPAVLATDQNAAYDVASNGHGFAAVVTTPDAMTVVTWSAAGVLSPQTASGPGNVSRNVALASDGDGYLAVWPDVDRLRAMRITAAGASGVPWTLVQAGIGEQLNAPALLWNGSRYVIAYTKSDGSGTRWHSAQLDRATMEIVEDEEHGVASQYEALSLAEIGGRVRAAWEEFQYAPTQMRVLGDEDAGEPVVTWGAPPQELGAAVSTADRMLVVWNELLAGTRTLHSGIRFSDGSWREQQIGGNEIATEAVANGNAFAVLVDGNAIGLDANGRKLWQTSGTLFQAIAPSSSGYVAVYLQPGARSWTFGVARLSGSGVVSSRVPIGTMPFSFSVSIASDGNGALVVWSGDYFTGIPYTFSRSDAMRFGPNLERLDADPLLLDPEGDEPHATWDGASYRVVWSRYESVMMCTLPAAGEALDFPASSIAELARYVRGVRMASFSGGTAVWWLYDAVPALFLGRFWPQRDDAPVFEDRNVVQLADGAIAYVGVERQNAAPYHGAHRLMMVRRDAAPQPVPDPPVITVRAYNGQLRVEWTAPPQPVTGYRVEYRIGDGSWNEMPRWFDPDQRLAPWASVKAGQTYAFRVRAWSENGTSAYSTPAVAYMGRRRAVR